MVSHLKQIYGRMSEYKKYTIYYRKIRNLSPILLVSSPKSGNTWWRFIYSNLANIVEQYETNTVTFWDIEELVPREDKMISRFKYSKLPPVIKTHRPYQKYYGKMNSIYIYRNPLDVIVSQYHHVIKWEGALDPTVDRDSIGDAVSREKEAIKMREMGIQQFLRKRLPDWFNHLRSWQSQATTLCRYEDMQQFPIETVTSCLEAVGIRLPEPIIAEAVQKSDASVVKNIEVQYGKPLPEGILFDKLRHRFVRDSRSDQWYDYFDESDLKFARNMCEQYNKHGFKPHIEI